MVLAAILKHQHMKLPSSALKSPVFTAVCLRCSDRQQIQFTPGKLILLYSFISTCVTTCMVRCYICDMAPHEHLLPATHTHTYTLFAQDKLYQEEYQLVVSEEENEQISTKLSEASAWMDEDGYSATTRELREKLVELKSLCKAMFFRVEERRKWPDRLAALDSMLNTSSFFLKWERGRRWHQVRDMALFLFIWYMVVIFILLFSFKGVPDWFQRKTKSSQMWSWRR